MVPGMVPGMNQAAIDAAARVNAMLAAQGGAPGAPGGLALVPGAPPLQISTQIQFRRKKINQAATTQRNILTRKQFQMEITAKTGITVNTKGKYYTEEELKNRKDDDEEPIYLELCGTSEDKLKQVRNWVAGCRGQGLSRDSSRGQAEEGARLGFEIQGVV